MEIRSNDHAVQIISELVNAVQSRKKTDRYKAIDELSLFASKDIISILSSIQISSLISSLWTFTDSELGSYLELTKNLDVNDDSNGNHIINKPKPKPNSTASKIAVSLSKCSVTLTKIFEFAKPSQLSKQSIINSITHVINILEKDVSNLSNEITRHYTVIICHILSNTHTRNALDVNIYDDLFHTCSYLLRVQTNKYDSLRPTNEVGFYKYYKSRWYFLEDSSNSLSDEYNSSTAFALLIVAQGELLRTKYLAYLYVTLLWIESNDNSRVSEAHIRIIFSLNHLLSKFIYQNFDQLLPIFEKTRDSILSMLESRNKLKSEQERALYLQIIHYYRFYVRIYCKQQFENQEEIRAWINPMNLVFNQCLRVLHDGIRWKDNVGYDSYFFDSVLSLKSMDNESDVWSPFIKNNSFENDADFENIFSSEMTFNMELLCSVLLWEFIKYSQFDTLQFKDFSTEDITYLDVDYKINRLNKKPRLEKFDTGINRFISMFYTEDYSICIRIICLMCVYAKIKNPNNEIIVNKPIRFFLKTAFSGLSIPSLSCLSKMTISKLLNLYPDIIENNEELIIVLTNYVSLEIDNAIKTNGMTISENYGINFMSLLNLLASISKSHYMVTKLSKRCWNSIFIFISGIKTDKIPFKIVNELLNFINITKKNPYFKSQSNMLETFMPDIFLLVLKSDVNSLSNILSYIDIAKSLTLFLNSSFYTRYIIGEVGNGGILPSSITQSSLQEHFNLKGFFMYECMLMGNISNVALSHDNDIKSRDFIEDNRNKIVNYVNVYDYNELKIFDFINSRILPILKKKLNLKLKLIVSYILMTIVQSSQTINEQHIIVSENILNSCFSHLCSEEVINYNIALVDIVLGIYQNIIQRSICLPEGNELLKKKFSTLFEQIRKVILASNQIKKMEITLFDIYSGFISLKGNDPKLKILYDKHISFLRCNSNLSGILISLYGLQNMVMEIDKLHVTLLNSYFNNELNSFCFSVDKVAKCYSNSHPNVQNVLIRTIDTLIAQLNSANISIKNFNSVIISNILLFISLSHPSLISSLLKHAHFVKTVQKLIDSVLQKEIPGDYKMLIAIIRIVDILNIVDRKLVINLPFDLRTLFSIIPKFSTVFDLISLFCSRFMDDIFDESHLQHLLSNSNWKTSNDEECIPALAILTYKLMASQPPLLSTKIFSSAILNINNTDDLVFFESCFTLFTSFCEINDTNKFRKHFIEYVMGEKPSIAEEIIVRDDLINHSLFDYSPQGPTELTPYIISGLATSASNCVKDIKVFLKNVDNSPLFKRSLVYLFAFISAKIYNDDGCIYMNQNVEYFIYSLIDENKGVASKFMDHKCLFYEYLLFFFFKSDENVELFVGKVLENNELFFVNENLKENIDLIILRFLYLLCNKADFYDTAVIYSSVIVRLMKISTSHNSEEQYNYKLLSLPIEWEFLLNIIVQSCVLSSNYDSPLSINIISGLFSDKNTVPYFVNDAKFSLTILTILFNIFKTSKDSNQHKELFFNVLDFYTNTNTEVSLLFIVSLSQDDVISLQLESYFEKISTKLKCGLENSIYIDIRSRIFSSLVCLVISLLKDSSSSSILITLLVQSIKFICHQLVISRSIDIYGFSSRKITDEDPENPFDRRLIPHLRDALLSVLSYYTYYDSKTKDSLIYGLGKVILMSGKESSTVKVDSLLKLYGFLAKKNTAILEDYDDLVTEVRHELFDSNLSYSTRVMEVLSSLIKSDKVQEMSKNVVSDFSILNCKEPFILTEESQILNDNDNLINDVFLPDEQQVNILARKDRNLTWVSFRALVIHCVENFCPTSIFKLLVPLLKMSNPLCSKCFPMIVHLSLLNDKETLFKTGVAPARDFLSNVIKIMFQSPEKYPKDILTAIFHAVTYLRTKSHTFLLRNKTVPLDNNLWLQLDFTDAVHAAIFAEEYPSALLFLEIGLESNRRSWRVESFCNIQPSSFRGDITKPLQIIYKKTNDSDGNEGTFSMKKVKSLTDAANFLSDKHALDGKWDRVLGYSENPAFIGNKPKALMNTVESLSHIGYDRLVENYLRNQHISFTKVSNTYLDFDTSDLIDLQYSSVWKNMSWSDQIYDENDDESNIMSNVSEKILNIASHFNADDNYVKTINGYIGESLLNLRSIDDISKSLLVLYSGVDSVLQKSSIGINQEVTSRLSDEAYVSIAAIGVFNSIFEPIQKAFSKKPSAAFVVKNIVGYLIDTKFCESFDKVSSLYALRDKTLSLMLNFMPDKSNIEALIKKDLQLSYLSSNMYHFRESFASGRLHMASNVISNPIPGSYDHDEQWKALVQLRKLAFMEILWTRGDSLTAIQLLKDFLFQDSDNLNETQKDSISPFVRCISLKKLGEWVSNVKSESSTKILGYFREAVKLTSQIRDVRVQSDALTSFARYADNYYQYLLSHDSSEQLQENIKYLNHEINISDSIIGSSTSSSEKKQLLNAQRKMRRLMETDQNELDRYLKEREVFLLAGVEHYIRALTLSSSGKDAESVVFRLCTLWLENYSVQECNSFMDKFVTSRFLPTRKFIRLMYQLSARMDISKSSESTFQAILFKLVRAVCVDYPYHTLYHIIALVNGNVESDKDIKKNYRDKNVRNASSSSAVALLESLKDEATLKPIVEQVTSLCDACIELAYFPLAQKMKEKSDYIQIPRNLSLTKLDFDKVHVPTLNLPLRLPIRNYDGTIREYPRIVPISSFSNKFALPGGVNMPKKVECIGEDGRVYVLLLKSNDDLRQDAVITSIFQKVNTLLSSNPDTRRRHMQMRIYNVIPLAPRAGLVEWVTNTISIGEYLTVAHSIYNKGDWSHKQCRNLMRDEFSKSTSTADSKLECYMKIVQHFKPAMRHFFTESYPNPEEWLERRLTYTRSVAVSSIAGYIVGLGDRHSQNILIDRDTAEIIHIDLGIAFDQGKLLNIPEVVPFRLTRDVVDGMGCMGIEGHFRRFCEETLQVLRANSDTVLAILDVFRYDPLYNWKLTLSEKFKRQTFDEEEINNNVYLNMSGIAQNENAAPTVTENSNKNAERALFVVKQKLSDSTSCECVVNDLIQSSIDSRNLSRLYFGWGAWM